MLEGDWTNTPDISLDQTWDGVDGSSSLLNTGSLSSLPFGEAEAAEAAAAATEGLPTYRNSSRTGGNSSSAPRYASSPSMLPINGYVGPPEDMSPEQAALEDYLMNHAVSEGMKQHHARREHAHSRFAVSVKFAELLERVESDDVRRNAAPILQGTSQKMPTWIRAGEELNELMDELNTVQAEAEVHWNVEQHARMQDEILEDVEKAMRLLAATNPTAGITMDEATDGTESLDELFGSDESTLLPGVGRAGLLTGDENGSREGSSRRRMISKFLDEIFPEGSDFSADIADSVFGGGDPRSETERALASIDEDVEKALEERYQSVGLDVFSDFEMEDEVMDEVEEEEDAEAGGVDGGSDAEVAGGDDGKAKDV